MKKTILIYACVLALGVFALEWLEYKYFMKMYSVQVYTLMLVLGFTAMGIWLGARLTRRTHADVFTRNTAALKTLGITKREYAVLSCLAGGQSNKEIARSLGISPNTVKTHMANLYAKLSVSKRVLAVKKAKALHLIA